MRPRYELRVLTGFGLFALALVLAYSFVPKLYLRLTQEDGVVENATVLAFLAASGLFLWAVPAAGRWRERAFLCGFGLLLIFAALEEMSYGQRLFKLQTPDWLAQLNLQGEINLHNTTHHLQPALRAKHLVGLCMSLWGLVLPLLSARFRPLRDLVSKLALPVPPLSIWPGFVLGAVLMVDEPTGWEEEYGELVYGICFILVAFDVARAHRHGRGRAPSAS